MPVPIWAGRYIGLPFKDHGRDRVGLDCWGLARLILGEQFGLCLPSYSHEYRTTADPSRIGPLIEREVAGWNPVASGAEQAGDIVILRLHGKPMHVGLVIGDRQMLHIESGINSAIERYGGPRWADRLYGFYRYGKETHDHDRFYDIDIRDW
jgi:cell wall-associated NlpC family hydrolase